MVEDKLTIIVKELFHDWKLGENPKFIEDLKTVTDEQFAISLHMTLGRSIRNHFGLWGSNKELVSYFHSIGIMQADDMSHKIFLELYKYGKEQFDIIK